MPDKVCQKVVVNLDCPMPIGRLAAQGAHASWLSVLGQGHWEGQSLVIPCEGKPWLEAWLKGEFTKVFLRGWGDGQLIGLKDRAEACGLPVGLMEEEGCVTALAIGPADTALIDSAIGRLNLL